MTKAQCILLWLTTRLARKKTLSAQCLEKEHLQIMPVLNGFTPVLKTETFYFHNRRKYNKDSITNIVKNYITFYNETRIQQRLNDQSPVQYRKLIA